ncbi:MAG: helix-turn-helix transcriptional regulator [Pseudomonadota bacterium]
MPIVVRLDVMLALRKMRSRELAQEVGITEANLSLLKSGKVKGVRFETLEKICAALDCQPGDILEYAPAPAPEGERKGDTQPEANAPPTKPASADP